MLLGAAVLIKPNLALVIVLLGAELVIRGRWRDLAWQAAGLAAGGLVAVAIATLRFGSLAPWGEWLTTLREMGQVGFPVAAGNYSLSRLIDEQAGADLSAILVAGLAAGVVAVLLLARCGPNAAEPVPDPITAERRRWGREVLIIGAAIAITLLGSPLSWLHYYLLLTPLVIFLVRPADGGSGDPGHVVVRQSAAVAALVLLSFAPLPVIWSQPDAHAHCAAAVAAAGLLLAAALFELVLESRPGLSRIGRRMVSSL